MSNTSAEDDAIVLNSIDSGESDLILTLFCKEIGRTAVIAKGARRSKKRFVNKLEIFTHLNIELVTNGRGLPLLKEAELHAIFQGFRTSYSTYFAASVLREFLLYGIKEGESDSQLFLQLLSSFEHLENDNQPETTVLFFLLRYFERIGYRPELTHCTQCGAPVTSTKSFTFDNLAGGLLCSDCKSSRSPICLGTIRTLQAAQSLPDNRLWSLQPTHVIRQEGLQLLHNYGRHILQHDINSWSAFISTLQKKK